MDLIRRLADFWLRKLVAIKYIFFLRGAEHIGIILRVHTGIWRNGRR